MKTRELVCILCPNGCRLQAEILPVESPAVGEVTGNLCEKGPEWAKQEILHPVRSISTSVLVRGGLYPLVSVKTDTPIAREKIFDVMKEIRALVVNAPIHMGDALIRNPAGTQCAIVATRSNPQCIGGRD